ncbi:hypothetical protein PSD17_51550 [Pseudonocardia sp. D17]|nr:hypothetical protein PSD17_51550 [Pseudonocardia sp. D17]
MSLTTTAPHIATSALTTRAWHPVAASDDAAPRHVFQGELHDRELAIWRADDGFVNVWENRCLHRGVRLSIGVNDGRELRCQYHGWRYSTRTATCTYIPAHPADAPARTISNRTYPVVERYGLIWTTLDDHRPQDVPDLPGADGDVLVLRAVEIAVPASSAVERLRTHGAADGLRPAGEDDLVLRFRGDPAVSGSGLTLFVQLTGATRCVVRGVLQEPGPDHLDLLRQHNRLLTRARARIWVVENAFAHRPFADTEQLRAAFQNALFSGPPDQQRELLARYPALDDDADPHTPRDGATPDIGHLGRGRGGRPRRHHRGLPGPVRNPADRVRSRSPRSGGARPARPVTAAELACAGARRGTARGCQDRRTPVRRPGGRRQPDHQRALAAVRLGHELSPAPRAGRRVLAPRGVRSGVGPPRSPRRSHAPPGTPSRDSLVVRLSLVIGPTTWFIDATPCSGSLHAPPAVSWGRPAEGSRAGASSIAARSTPMPLWKIHHPVGAYSADDKKQFSDAITEVYTSIPIPRFYVVVLFEEVAAENFYVGGDVHDHFVRINIDQMARTLPGATLREFWVRNLDRVIAPWVKDRGYDWEFTITEPPFDLWSLQGEIPPPFESLAEARWIEENKATPYEFAEKLPVSVRLTPGFTPEDAKGR